MYDQTRDRSNNKKWLTRTVQYSVWSSSNPIAARRLNPFPATPFSGRGMLGNPVDWAVAALRKILFSADRIGLACKCVRTRFAYLPCSFFILAAYWACNLLSVWSYEKRTSSLKNHLLVSASFWGVEFSSVQVPQSDRYSIVQQKKLPVWAYFLMLCRLVCFNLADDAATSFLAGGPVLKGGRADFACEWLDFEEDAIWTMRGCWQKTTNVNALKYI